MCDSITSVTICGAITTWAVAGFIGILFIKHMLNFKGGFSTSMAAFFFGIVLYEIFVNKLCFFLTKQWFHHYVLDCNAVPPYLSLPVLLVFLVLVFLVKGDIQV